VASRDSIFGRATFTRRVDEGHARTSTAAIRTQVCCRLADGSALEVERMTTHRNGRALRVLNTASLDLGTCQYVPLSPLAAH